MSPNDQYDKDASFPDDGSFYLADARYLQTYIVAEQQLSQFQAPVFIHASDPHERLYVACLDGTGNDETKPQLGPITNVAKIHDLIYAADNGHIQAGYTPGPGTQDGWFARIRDGLSGRTYDERVEDAYKKFIDQASKWKDEDPLAEIRVALVGFSRGAEQEAGLARLIHERGIQNSDGAIYTRGPDGLITHVEYTKPALVAPGQVAQAEMLFDPVGTGYPMKHEDRRPPPSVISGFQIIAADERRRAFKSDHIIDPGITADGRFLGVTVAGAHGDIGGGYERDGLSIRNENFAINYLNSLSDVAFLAAQAVPDDPRMSVVHRPERAFLYAFMRTVNRAAVNGTNESLVPGGEVNRIRDPRNAEPRDDALNRQFERQPLTSGLQAITQGQGQGRQDAPTQPITSNSSTQDMFEALCAAAADKNPHAMRLVEHSYLQSDAAQIWLAQGHEMNQHIQAQTPLPAFAAQLQPQMPPVAPLGEGYCR